MLATKIFPKTFRNFQQMIARNKMVEQKVLKTTSNPLTQFHIANLYAISNLVSLQLSELQKDHVIDMLQSFNFKQRVLEKEKNQSKISSQIYYDQTNHFFKLKYFYEMRKTLPLLQTIQQIKNAHQLEVKSQNQNFEGQSLEVEIKLKNCEQEKMDHPSIRETLYFHELKDFDNYIKYKPLPKTPLFVQDMNRKKLEMKVLDQKNPYGFPLKAPPLIFDVEMANKVYFRVKSTFEETNVIEVGSLKKRLNQDSLDVKKQFSISGMKIPRNIQEMIYKDIINSIMMIDDDQLLRFHRLAYIGGRVQKLNILMDVHQTMAMENQELFDKFFS